MREVGAALCSYALPRVADFYVLLPRTWNRPRLNSSVLLRVDFLAGLKQNMAFHTPTVRVQSLVREFSLRLLNVVCKLGPCAYPISISRKYYCLLIHISVRKAGEGRPCHVEVSVTRGLRGTRNWTARLIEMKFLGRGNEAARLPLVGGCEAALLWRPRCWLSYGSA